jgi:hypothetical protein
LSQEGDAKENRMETKDLKWGFDLTQFHHGPAWADLLRAHAVSDYPTLTERGWMWEGEDVTVWTLYNPHSGARCNYPDRVDSRRYGFAGYIGIEGKKNAVEALAEGIRGRGWTKDESPGECEYI